MKTTEEAELPFFLSHCAFFDHALLVAVRMGIINATPKRSQFLKGLYGYSDGLDDHEPDRV